MVGQSDNRGLQVIGDGLRGVEDLAATDADDDVATVVASERNQAIDLALGALAVKVLKQQLGLSSAKPPSILAPTRFLPEASR